MAGKLAIDDRDPYLLKRAQGIASEVYENGLRAKANSVINAGPLDRVLKTSTSQAQIINGTRKLDDEVAIIGALAVGAQIREDMAKANGASSKQDTVHKRVLNMRKLATKVRLKARVREAATEPPSKLTKEQIKELSQGDHKTSYNALLQKILEVR